jgi:hypothetical protein
VLFSQQLKHLSSTLFCVVRGLDNGANLIQYGHNSRFGGEADSGWHRGQVEFAGGERRVRAGDDYVKWQQSQLDWWAANGNANNRPAMVYHAFKLNSNDCGDIKIANTAWSWSNLPGWQGWTKRAGCWTGTHNEIRFLIYNYNVLVVNQSYYFQHLFKDEKWPASGGTQRGEGKITAGTYHDRDDFWVGHVGVTEDYHGVFCVWSNNDTAGGC